MLQLKTAGSIALDNLGEKLSFPPRWETQEELEDIVNRCHRAFLDERFNVSKQLGGLFLVAELTDRAIRTGEQEHMDNPSMSSAKKLEMIVALERMNAMMRLYPGYISVIEPSIRTIARQKHRPARILELASGAGGLALAIAKKVKQHELPAEITGSDIVPEYVDYCNEQAEEKSLPVQFKTINAFGMDFHEGCECDIILLAQSMHHFSPGQLARIIVQSRMHGAQTFMGLDGHRGIDLVAGVPLTAMLQGIPLLALDGLTSARKFYSEIELDMIASIAMGRKLECTFFSWPLTVLDLPLQEKNPSSNTP